MKHFYFDGEFIVRCTKHQTMLFYGRKLRYANLADWLNAKKR